MDNEINKAHETPGQRSRKGSVFGSLEKMFNMLTPKKQSKSSTEGARKVKVSPVRDTWVDCLDKYRMGLTSCVVENILDSFMHIKCQKESWIMCQCKIFCRGDN